VYGWVQLLVPITQCTTLFLHPPTTDQGEMRRSSTPIACISAPNGAKMTLCYALMRWYQTAFYKWLRYQQQASCSWWIVVAVHSRRCK